MCDVCCKFIMAAERQDVILALKEHLAEAGLGPPLVEPEARPVHWAEGLHLKTLPTSRAPLLLFVGAGANRQAQHSGTARKLAQLLQHAHVDFGIPEGAEPESGIEAYWRGHRAGFETQGRQTAARLDESGATTIVTLCGEDLGMLRAKYPRAGFAPRAAVVHASELLLALLARGKLRLTRPVRQSVTYHDPCYLGRQSEPTQAWQGQELRTHGVMTYFSPPKPVNYGVQGVFDAPRQVLRAIPGLRLVEMHRIREYAYCCGGGGGVPDSHPEVARSASRQRLAEARDVGAELLVSACQHCRQNLSRWQEQPTLPVVDLVDLVYDAAGLG
jgi:Fe-S oxidoreductase